LVSAGPPEIRELNTDTFRLNLKDIEDSTEHMAFPDTHRHIEPVSVGGVALARVIEIINGYTITFENGTYAVNLNGSNNNIGDVLNLNNVQVRSSNSAGLTFSKQVEDQSFTDSRVWVNTTGAGQSGTQFPIGTPGTPVDNLADAQTIISNRTLPKRLDLRGNLTVGASDSLDNYNIRGAGSKNLAKLTVITGASTSNLIISNCEIEGDMSGSIVADDVSSFTGLTDFEGAMVCGGIEGVITLANTDLENRIEFINCHSRVAGTGTPVIDCNNLANLELSIRGYHGGIELRNVSLASMSVSVDMDAGHLILASSCTNGTISVKGVGELTDNSAGSTINVDGFLEGVQPADYGGGVHIDTVTGVAGTQFPVGTISRKSNNVTDSKAIADVIGLNSYLIHDDIVLNAPHPEWKIVGFGRTPTVDLNNQNVNGSFYEEITLTGVMNGQVKAIECVLDTLTGAKGTFQSCGLKGTVILTSGVTVTFDKCYSTVPGLGTPVIDFGVGGGATSANIRAYAGGLELRNMDGAGKKCTVDLTSGRLIVDSSCTAGELVVRGTGHITNNSTGVTINTQGFVEGWRVQFAEQILANNYTLSDVNGDMIITLDDGTTLVSKAYADIAKTVPWAGSGAILARDKFVVV
jgi:hypothetical protein